MAEEKSKRHLLICENDPGLQGAFDLMLGRQYGLVFTDDPIQIKSILAQHSICLLIWDLDQVGSGSNRILGILKEFRQAQPDLKVLLIAEEFKYSFQVSVIQQCGVVSFQTKPWKSASGIVEQIQIILGDKKNTIQRWQLKMPISPTLNN